MAHSNGPESFEQLQQYCLRRNGSPVVDINVSESQVNDAIYDALAFFSEYHHDATELVYVRHEITQSELDSGILKLPENITDVTRVFNPANDNQTSASSLFDVNYQIRLNDIWDTSSLDMTYHYLAMSYISFVNDMLNTRIRYEYNQYTNELKLFTDFESINNLQIVLIEAYSQIHPDIQSRLWGHWVLRDLAAAYVKRQWGMNLSKFQELQLPGGVTMNGEQLYQQAIDEIEKIKEEFIMKFQEPDEFLIR